MMPEYIERETLLNELSEELEDESPLYTKEQNELINMGLKIAMKDVKYSHAADVVEVIRCKDCAHYGGITFGNICRRWSGLNVKNCTKPDDYCSYGIRKDGNK